MTKCRLTSQSAHILAHMQSGRSITQLEAIMKFGCARLSAHIHEMRGAGHDVKDRWVIENGKQYKAYYMEAVK